MLGSQALEAGSELIRESQCMEMESTGALSQNTQCSGNLGATTGDVHHATPQKLDVHHATPQKLRDVMYIMLLLRSQMYMYAVLFIRFRQ